MVQKLTEQQVLDRMGIPDFRHMTKEKVVSFVSLLPHMDTEVAKKALEQFPDFSKTTLAITEQLMVSVKSIVTSNETTTTAFLATCEDSLQDLRLLLSKDDLSSEERIIIIDTIKQILDLMYRKDSENKVFLDGVIKYVITFCGGALICLGAVLGLNASSHNN